MKRRDFIRRSGHGVLGLGVLGAVGCGPTATPNPRFKAWTWVHGTDDLDPAGWLDRFGRLRDSGFEAVLVSGGDLQMLSDAARASGLEFHRWMWTLNRNGDTFAQEQHPEWFTVSRAGASSLESPPYVGYYRWACPSREPVRAYLRGIVDELAADDRIDGVHLDYVRYCDVILPRGLWDTYDLVQDHEMPEFDFCYCEVCAAAFEEQTGLDPRQLEDAPSNQAWVQYRWDTVTRLVAELAEVVHGYEKPITAAVFPTPTLARKLVRQAWDQWPVDAVFPMLYHSFYLEDLEWIGDSVREGLASGIGSMGRGTAPPGQLHAGLYLPDLSPEEMGRAVDIARAAGASGVSLFESGGLTEEHQTVMRAALGL